MDEVAEAAAAEFGGRAAEAALELLVDLLDRERRVEAGDIGATRSNPSARTAARPGEPVGSAVGAGSMSVLWGWRASRNS
ncbi:hypothetical protein ACFQVA_00820 [Actinomadura keratinilytica]